VGPGSAPRSPLYSLFSILHIPLKLYRAVLQHSQWGKKHESIHGRLNLPELNVHIGRFGTSQFPSHAINKIPFSHKKYYLFLSLVVTSHIYTIRARAWTALGCACGLGLEAPNQKPLCFEMLDSWPRCTTLKPTHVLHCCECHLTCFESGKTCVAEKNYNADIRADMSESFESFD